VLVILLGSFMQAALADLRHMHVNKAGVDARTIADRIGHTDPAFTLKRYAHVCEDQRKAAAIPLYKLLHADEWSN
jgi:integrase